MTRHPALPFTVTHSDDTIGKDGIQSTTERVHGLLRIDGATLAIQWRTATTIEQMGPEIRSEDSVGAIEERSLPLTAIAQVRVRTPWPGFWRKPRLVLTAADLRAFETLVGAGGLQRTHPAELTLVLRRADRLAAEEFAADLMLAIAERGLASGTEASRPRLPG